MQTNVKPTNVDLWLFPEVKQEAERIFANHGLTMSDAIAVFINHIYEAKCFPFEVEETKWQDANSLAALEESRFIEANPEEYRIFKNAAAVIADCLEGADDE